MIGLHPEQAHTSLLHKISNQLEMRRYGIAQSNISNQSEY